MDLVFTLPSLSLGYDKRETRKKQIVKYNLAIPLSGLMSNKSN